MISNINPQYIAQKKILVVGGSGFIGQALVRRLLDYEAKVVVSLSKKDSRIPIVSDSIVADIRNSKEVARKIGGLTFEYVFNLGGYIDHSPYLKGGRDVVNAHYIGTLNILNSVYHPNLIKFVQVGSSDEYGNSSAPQQESLRESPISPYSSAKVGISHLIQALSRAEGFPGVVVRFFLVYGPGQDDRRFLPQIIKGCLDNKKFPTSSGKQIRDFCYIDDVVDALILAATKPEIDGQIINIASGEPVTIKSVIEKVVKFIGKGKPDFGAYPYRAGENMELYADINKAKEVLAWSPRISLDEGIKRTVEWYAKKLKVE